MEMQTLEQWIEEVKETAKIGWNKTKQWCRDHKAELVVFGPVLISSGIEIIKIAAKKSTVNEEKRLKENYVYDRSMGIGHYYELRRKLRSSEWLQIEQRKLEGETLGEILTDMRVLK